MTTTAKVASTVKAVDTNKDGIVKPHIYRGLEGVIVSETSVSTVGIPQIGLSYRGYGVPELIEKSSFEEVALLLIKGEIPSDAELKDFKAKIVEGRKLSAGIKGICESLDKDSHPMCVLSACVSYYGASGLHDDVANMCARLMGLVPSCITYWYKYSHDNIKIDTSAVGDEMSVAAHFLSAFYGRPADTAATQAFSASLIAYAEHDLNASTFSARVTCSTLADYYSCIVSAINTLKGPLHGGANEAALNMLKSFPDKSVVPGRLTEMLAKKEKIMGFGHRVYKNGDPRSDIMKKLSMAVMECPGCVNKDTKMFETAEVLETEMITRKKIYPNLDYYAAVAYHCLGLPSEIYTVIFAMGRLAGWSSHILEQKSNNHLIRPKSFYVGEPVRPFSK